MTNHQWHYCGDISLAYGGYFWREDGADDYVLVVRVTPCSDAGGPDNLFWIEEGSLYIPDNRPDELKSALDCCGYKEEKPSRAVVVESLIAYRGFDHDPATVVRFGPAQPAGHEFGSIEPDVILRANASLKNYVKKNFLN
jgi:hypothetical protein